jgi:hypothetical protein
VQPGSVQKCEGMGPHTFKWTPSLEVGVLMDFWICREWFEGPIFIGLRTSLYCWRALKT